MPTYDYECRKCAKGFEISLLFAEKEKGTPVPCPACKSTQTFQVFRRVNMVDAHSSQESRMDAPDTRSSPGCFSPGCHSYCGGC
jgi:putative FmdB family regulatory protein